MSVQLLQSREVAPPAKSQDPQAVLDVLDNPRCRAVLGCLDHRPLTADELTACTELPKSTLYRYLNRLVDAGMIEESVRMDAAGRHPSEYTRVVSAVTISLDADGFSVAFN